MNKFKTNTDFEMDHPFPVTDCGRRRNPGSKLKTAVTGKVKPGSKAAKRRKAFCARSRSWTSARGKAARRRWKC